MLSSLLYKFKAGKVHIHKGQEPFPSGRVYAYCGATIDRSTARYLGSFKGSATQLVSQLEPICKNCKRSHK